MSSTTVRFAERQVINLVHSGELAIDAFGRVWRLAYRRGRTGGGTMVAACNPRRAENPTTNGYLQVRALIDGVRWCAGAHRLVWQHYHGDIPAGLTINHDNGDKTDNRPGNLLLATDQEQTAHAIRTGLHVRDRRGRYTEVTP